MLQFQRLWQKIRYNSISRLIHDGLIKIGINITLFYLVEEGLHLQPAPFEGIQFSDYSIEFLKEDGLDIICSVPERPYKKEFLINRMEKGCSCLVVSKDHKLIGYTWFNVSECTFDGYRFALKENEAYLFDAYILIEHRGKKIGPFIRYQCYKELNNLNKTTLYSISDSLNKQSIRFKEKLNAKFLLLGLYICLFNKIKFSRQIKLYEPG